MLNLAFFLEKNERVIRPQSQKTFGIKSRAH